MATVLEPAVHQMSIRPIRLEEYHWLIEHKFFQENERVELYRRSLAPDESRRSPPRGSD